MSTSDRSGFWLRFGLAWGILFGLALAGIVFQVTQGAQALYCGPPNEDVNCGREWVSASSGWIAFLGAVITVWIMSGQRRDALEIQRQNVALQLQEKVIVVRNLKNELKSLDSAITTIEHFISRTEQSCSPNDYTGVYISQVKIACATVLSVCSSPARIAFDQQIGRVNYAGPDMGADQFIALNTAAQEALDHLLDYVQKSPNGPIEMARFFGMKVRPIKNPALLFLKNYEGAINTFLDTWKGKTMIDLQFERLFFTATRAFLDKSQSGP